MKLKEFLTDDDAVSPVIGVILMVAITVILAAVIASFVLGLGDSTSTTPTASFDFEAVDTNDDGTIEEVKITYQSGDTLDESNTEVKGTSTSVWDGTGEITAGSSVSVAATGGDTVRVVWESDSGDSSSTLGEYTVPN